MTREIQVLNQKLVSEGDIFDGLKMNKVFDIEVIEMDKTLGLSIDREANTKLAHITVHEDEYWKIYFPANMQYGDQLELTRRVLVKIKTPIKLNLINKDGQEMISKEDVDKREVHFVQFEAAHETQKVAWTLALLPWRKYNVDSWEVHDWKITDFDHCLKGNAILRK